MAINLIQNGTFDTNLNGWLFYSNGYNSTWSIIGGECVISIPNIGTNMQLWQDNIKLLPNKKYILSFELYTQTSGKPFEVILHSYTGTYVVITSYKIPATSVTKTKHTHEFTTPAAIPSDLRLRLWFTQTGIYYIDNISLSEPSTKPTPVSHWAFEESSGTEILDSITNPVLRNGYIQGGVTRVPGIIGNALQFDGITGTVIINNADTLPLSARSISLWVNVFEYSHHSYLFHYGVYPGNFYIGINGFGVHGGAVDNITIEEFFIPNKWYHIVLTYDGTTARLYGNGVQLGEKPATWNISSHNLAYINLNWNYTASPFKGKIDEVKIFDKAMSPEEVLAEYNEVPHPSCNPVICTMNLV